RHAMPAIYPQRDFAEVGGLRSSITDAWRQSGAYVGRILAGAKPAGLPVLQSKKLEMVINAQTARVRSRFATGASPKSGPSNRIDNVRFWPPKSEHSGNNLVTITIVLFAVLARREIAAVDRLRLELRRVVLPICADVVVSLDHRVPEFVLVVAEHHLLLDLLD